METTTINKERVVEISGSVFVKFHTSREEGKALGRVDAYIYNAGDRVGSAFCTPSDAKVFMERLTALPAEAWKAVTACVTDNFLRMINE